MPVAAPHALPDDYASIRTGLLLADPYNDLLSDLYCALLVTKRPIGATRGTFHILVVAGNGGYVFADNLQDKDDAEWTAALLNAAIGAAPPLDKQGK